MAEPDWLTQHQTLVTGSAAFAGVMISLLVNAWLQKRQHTRSVQHEATVLRRAFFADLRAHRERFCETMELAERAVADDAGSVEVNLRSRRALFEASVGKLGLLTTGEVVSVTTAYSSLGDQEAYAVLIGRAAEEPGREGVYAVKSEKLPGLVKSLGILVHHLDVAIEEITRQARGV